MASKTSAKKLEPAAKKTSTKASSTASKETKPAASSATLSASEVAAELGTDGRTLRKFLRASSHYEAVGQGKRYSFTKKDVGPMKKRFDEWRSTTARKAAEKKAEREAKQAAAEGRDLDIEVEEIDLEEEDA